MAHSPEYLPIAINGTSYMVDTEGYSRTTIPVLREQRDTSDEAGEQQLNTQMWIRSQTDWSYGAGQKYFDNTDSDRRRFYTSSGVDVWTEGQVTLLPKMVDKGNTGNDVIMKQFRGASIDYLYVADGSTLYFSTNFDTASPTWSTVTSIVGAPTITDFDSDGTTLWVAYGAADQLHSTTLGSTAAPSSLVGHTTNDEIIRFVGGRLMGATGATAVELAANGSAITTFDGLVHNTTWVDFAVGPTGMYGAANTEDVGTILFFPIGADGVLDFPAQVADLPHGETINQIESYGGLLVLATSKGIRVAQMNAGGVQGGGIAYGPLINDVGAVYSIATDERFVWFGGENGQLYRIDLSKFTDILVPAWASDVVSTGVSPGNVTWVVRVNGKTYFVDAANGVQGTKHDGELVEFGTVNTGSVRWNSLFNKVLQTVKADLEPTLATTGSTEYDDSAITYDDAEYIYNGVLSPISGALKVTFVTGSGISLSQITLTDRIAYNIDYALSDLFDVNWRLERDSLNNTVGPVFQSWQLQAFPAPTRIDEIVLPIVLKKRVATSRGNGRALTQNPRALFDAIRNLMIAKTVVPYEEGNYSDDVIVDQVQFAPERLADDGDWWEGTMTVRLLTLP